MNKRETGEALQRAARERITKLQLTSDIFLSVVLDDARSCEEVVRILTGRDISIEEVKTQYSIRQLETRSVILDIYAVEEDGARVTLEMHPREDEDYLRRNRYNISSIDMNLLDKGVDYEHLPEVHAIYMSHQKFGKTNHAIKKIVRNYNNLGDTIEGVNVNNGIHEYYVNLTGDAETKEQEDLLKYLMDTAVFKEHKAFPNLIKRVRYYKEEKEGVEIMCEVMDDLLERSRDLGMELGMEQGMELGMEQGMELGKEQGMELGEIRRSVFIIKNLVMNMGITTEEAVEMIGIPEVERERYLELATKSE